MRFEKIFIPQEYTEQIGLSEIKLIEKKIGSVLAFVGQNGAGKSRVLRFIEGYISTISSNDLINGYISNFPVAVKEILGVIIDDIINLNNPRLPVDAVMEANLHEENNGYQPSLREDLLSSLEVEKVILNNYIKVVNNEDLRKIKDTLSNDLTFEEILSNTSSVDLHKFNAFTELNNGSTFEYFRNKTDEILETEIRLIRKNRRNVNLITQKLAENKSFELFSKFQKHVQNFLGKEFSYDDNPNSQGNKINSVLTFDGIPFNVDDLSPGQKMLLSYAILFFYMEVNGQNNLKDCIIIIDEPELHLHPKAQINLINSLKGIVEDRGQLILATHSVHILSHLQYDEIFMVRNGEITLPKRTTPGESLVELMGLRENVDELEDFIVSISKWAYSNFITQCFKDPDVVLNIDVNDPQYLLFKKFILESSRINLLDFGAGRGRTGRTIQEDNDLKDKIFYTPFEPNEKLHESLFSIFGVNEVFTAAADLPTDKYDIVLICNVLHEISPEYWVELMVNLKRVLQNEGYIVFIEDKNLPKGECAHEFGYLILNARQLKLLLNASETLELEFEAEKNRGRFTFCAIKKENINPTNLSLISALTALKEDSYSYLKTIKKTGDVSQGRVYGNYSQLHINASLALEKLSQDIVDQKILLGRWRCDYILNNKPDFEICEITKDGKYLVGGEHYFNLVGFGYDKMTKRIHFTKIAARRNDDRIYANDLRIDSGDLIGLENGIEISYKRLIEPDTEVLNSFLAKSFKIESDKISEKFIARLLDIYHMMISSFNSYYREDKVVFIVNCSENSIQEILKALDNNNILFSFSKI